MSDPVKPPETETKIDIEEVTTNSTSDKKNVFHIKKDNWSSWKRYRFVNTEPVYQTLTSSKALTGLIMMIGKFLIMFQNCFGKFNGI